MESREWDFTITPAGHMPGQVHRELDDLIRGMAGKRVRLILELSEKIRTLPQNRFYQGPFIKAFQKCLLDCGERVSRDDIHEGLRNGYAKNGYNIGEYLRIPPSTKRLSTTGFEDYLEEIRAHYAGKFGWQLPFPGEIPIEAYNDIAERYSI